MTHYTKRQLPQALLLRDIVVKRGAFALSVSKLALQRGEIACIVGLNGCGKTTLLLTILGLIPHDGMCYVGGERYDGSNPLVKSRLGFIPDDPDLLFEELTAREQWAVTASVLANVRS